ncbi:hypothetical protein PHYBLDRAFT_174110 [Phycomyces blakesleeanus NRRL 1555(-)]|uniref:HAUS augmin-like complex subunit 6 N-terminal domain-containing protein n=1 Tax=Phycomyces blakesleeanus (strain ATCC 8743b / DSM 1359 / FGSC 10004 / NBRC 33097 / NRRL 1555) TaxID=763407 RepID=A0A167K7H8_PHYB8|nr:hypothetical protein PHYBLDRAFT_174110 [Phycomyces blakesleeanus NRRL 1555(-)]OAD67420.1 hypothetical protein PHYBLDRAFT_174110 [Phycomyces blakesleeanus NRRL 1555(-)]|eukprot:XP_018285460.1 hypothetical protein PHYBLDRAFT_174110 [Phycomyces blakesleeanus NRRL 1555(-)]
MSSVADSFLANLKILGFDPEVYATGIFSNIRFGNDMFTRNADNNKAFEITSHFLFSKLDPIQTKKTFRDCWPITDYKRHSREYRAAAYRWLEQLKRDNCLLGPVVLRRSYFEDCRGEHMNTIMLAFSTHVLQRTIDREILPNSPLLSMEHDRIQNEIDGIPMNINHIPYVQSLDSATNSLQDLLGNYASKLTAQVNKMKTYHEQWEKSAKFIANNLNSQSDRDNSDTSEENPNYPSTGSTALPQQMNAQNIRDRLKNILDTLRAKNEDISDAVSNNPVIVTRANQYKEQWASLYSRLREQLPEEKEDNIGFVLPEITSVPNESEAVDLVKRNVLDIISNETREQKLKEQSSKNTSLNSTKGYDTLTDKNNPPSSTSFITENNANIYNREITPELYPEHDTVYKTPDKQQVRPATTSSDWVYHKNTPGHYQKSQDDISPFSSNLSPIHAAIATDVIENFQRQRTPIHKDQSPSPYREWHRTSHHSFTHKRNRQPTDQLDVGGSSNQKIQKTTPTQKLQSPYREWHKRRRRSFEHRTTNPPDASILENDSPTYVHAAQQFSNQSSMEHSREASSQEIGPKRKSISHYMDSPTRNRSLDTVSRGLNKEGHYLADRSINQHESTQKDDIWGDLFTEKNFTEDSRKQTMDQTSRYQSPIRLSSHDNPDNQQFAHLFEHTPVHQMSSRGSYSYAEEDAPDIFGESQPSQFYHSD